MIDLVTKCVIYVITHVESGRKYVGQTVKKGSQRWREHCNAADGAFEHTYNGQMYIVRALRKYGVAAFKFEVVEQCARKDLDAREAFWIAELNSLAPNGFNLRSGALGVDGVKIASEVGQRISVANRGRVKGPEWRAALSKAHMGKVLTPEHRAKVGDATRGRKDSEETRLKKSLALKGRKLGPYSEERKAAVRAGMARMTDEAKIQMVELNSQARVGQKRGPYSEEHRAKISASNRGKKIPDEVRVKISLAQKGKKRGPYSVERIAAAREGLLRWISNNG